MRSGAAVPEVWQVTTFTSLALEAITCCHTGCGVRSGIEVDYISRLRETHAWFYCPNGHRQQFPQETEAERLKRQLTLTENSLTFARGDTQRARDRAKHAEARLRGTKGVVTRMRRRLVAGRCVCCSKQFKDLETHMKSRHPKWNPDRAAEALTEKAKA